MDLLAHEYGWTVDEIFDLPLPVIELLSEKISERTRLKTRQDLFLLVLGVRQAIVGTLAAKTRNQLNNWRSISTNFRNVIRSLAGEREKQVDTTRPLSDSQLQSLGFKREVENPEE